MPLGSVHGDPMGTGLAPDGPTMAWRDVDAVMAATGATLFGRALAVLSKSVLCQIRVASRVTFA